MSAMTHSWTDCAQSFHPFPGLIIRFILLGAGPLKDVLGERSRFELRQVTPSKMSIVRCRTQTAKGS